MWPWDIKGPCCTRFHLFINLPRAHSGCLCIVQCPKKHHSHVHEMVTLWLNGISFALLSCLAQYDIHLSREHLTCMCTGRSAFSHDRRWRFPFFLSQQQKEQNNCSFCSGWAERQRAAVHLSSVQKCSVCLHAKNTLYTSCNFSVMNRTLTRCG